MEKDGFQNQMVQFGYANQPNLDPFILVVVVEERPPPPPHMIVKRFGCTTIHNKVLYKCIIHSFIVCLEGITQFEHYTLNKTVFKKCSSLIHSLGHRSLGQNTAIVNFLRSAKVYNFAVPVDTSGISCPLTQRNYYNKSIINSWHSTSMQMGHG